MSDAEYWKKHWSGDAPPAPNNFARRAYKTIGKGRRALLDVGCGDGRDALYFASKGLRVTALDYSESGIKALGARNTDVHCVLADIQKMKFKPNSFEVIYAHLSLHYFDDRTTRRVFANIHRMLKKGGLFFVKCKSTDDALFGDGEKIGENIFRRGHIRHFFNKEYMAEQLRDFKILSLRKTSSVYHKYKSSFIEAIAKKI